MNKGTDATAFELLVATGQEMANQLRHLAENEIDSDSFAVVYENYNGRETEYERPITELAIQSAEQFDALIAALEQAEQKAANFESVANGIAAEKEQLQLQLGRYSMSAGEADQRRCESRAVREALGFGKDADNVAPIDLRNRIAALEASCDRNYIDGMKTGWNYCDAGNSDGFNECIDRRRKAIRAVGGNVEGSD